MLDFVSHKSSIVFTPSEKEEVNRFSLHFPFGSQLHKETTYFLSTIGDDGSRQCRSVSASFVRVLEKVIFIFESANICNGKIKGLAIHV